MTNINLIPRLRNILIINLLICILACDRSNDTQLNCLPRQSINTEINLNLPLYNELNNIGGYIYLNGPGTGSKGIIVVRGSNGFLIYDRNAPHICPENNTQLVVTDNIKITCPKDQAEWILITGQPIKVADRSPIRYAYNYDDKSKSLSIFN
jgi:nitrite reductase/ring-hydroxylating ferredoxin subunit